MDANPRISRVNPRVPRLPQPRAGLQNANHYLFRCSVYMDQSVFRIQSPDHDPCHFSRRACLRLNWFYYYYYFPSFFRFNCCRNLVKMKLCTIRTNPWSITTHRLSIRKCSCGSVQNFVSDIFCLQTHSQTRRFTDSLSQLPKSHINVTKISLKVKLPMLDATTTADRGTSLYQTFFMFAPNASFTSLVSIIHTIFYYRRPAWWKDFLLVACHCIVNILY